MALNPNFVDAVQYLYPNVDFRRDVILQDDGAGPYIKAWNLPGQPPTDQEIAIAVAAIPAAMLTAKKQKAKDIFDVDTVDKCIVKLVMSEINTLRDWITAFRAAVGAATNLANLQTRVTLLPDMPDRTNNQVVTALKNLIDQES